MVPATDRIAAWLVRPAARASPISRSTTSLTLPLAVAAAWAHARTLRLADGAALPYTEVMQLCAQCHGPQHRDYQHGAHGGMAGYWDLSKGGRTRANCIDCHVPHAPKYQPVQPARGPNDRGTAQEKESGHRE